MESKLIIYLLLGIVVIWLVLVGFDVMTLDFKIKGISKGYNDLPEKCRPPEGQDLASWKEHLSHHTNTQDCMDYFD